MRLRERGRFRPPDVLGSGLARIRSAFSKMHVVPHVVGILRLASLPASLAGFAAEGATAACALPFTVAAGADRLRAGPSTPAIPAAMWSSCQCPGALRLCDAVVATLTLLICLPVHIAPTVPWAPMPIIGTRSPVGGDGLPDSC